MKFNFYDTDECELCFIGYTKGEKRLLRKIYFKLLDVMDNEDEIQFLRKLLEDS